MAEAATKKKIFDGRYEVLSIVGRGPCSVVYHARHATALTSEVALKVLLNLPQKPGQAKNSDRLRKEALAMVSSRHKYVIRLDDFHAVGDLCYLAMEYAALGDLRKYAKTLNGRLTAEQGELFLTQSAEALDFVHRVGIVHRDIKPDNILVVNEKEIRLADFGVSVLPGEKAPLSDLSAGVGTMSYMAPEVLEGTAYDMKSDIYSLGVSFYEMFSGVHPFENAPLIKQLEVREDKNVPPLSSIEPTVPYYISNVIMQAMSFDPEKRFPTAKDLIQSLLVNKAQGLKPSPKIAVTAPVENLAEKIEPTDEPDFSIDDDNSSYEVKEVKSPPQGNPAIQNAIRDKIRSVAKPEHIMQNTPPANPAPQSAHTQQTTKQQHNNKQEPAKTPKLPRKSRLSESNFRLSRFLPLILLLIFGIAVYFLYLKPIPSNLQQEPPADSESLTLEDQNSPIPSNDEQAENSTLTFPALPSGVFNGTINGLLPNSPTSFSVISMPERGTQIYLLGYEGMSPQAIAVEADSESIRIAANGMILLFNGANSGNQLTGEVKNLITGEKGTWTLVRGKE